MPGGPIFATGKSRSGKSLICKLLGLHPHIAAHNREFRLWPRFYRRYNDLSNPDNFERCLAAMLSYDNIRSFINNDADYIRQKFWEGEPTYGRLFALLFEYHAERSGKPRWVDQSQKLERYAEAIFTNYPTAKMIHMIRDPRDRYASKNINRRRAGETNLGDLDRDIKGWLRSVRLAEQNLNRYPGRYKVVRYETLVSQPAETLHDICAFLGEADIPAELLQEGLQGFQDESGASKYNTVSTAYVGRFRQAMPRHQIAFIQARARQAMALYNYHLEPVQLSLRDYLLLYCVNWPVYLARKWKRSVKPLF